MVGSYSMRRIVFHAVDIQWDDVEDIWQLHDTSPLGPHPIGISWRTDKRIPGYLSACRDIFHETVQQFTVEARLSL